MKVAANREEGAGLPPVDFCLRCETDAVEAAGTLATIGIKQLKGRQEKTLYTAVAVIHINKSQQASVAQGLQHHGEGPVRERPLE